MRIEPVVKALIKPALRLLKSLKTSSTVLGLYGAPPSISLHSHSNSSVSIYLSLNLIFMRNKQNKTHIEIGECIGTDELEVTLL